MSVTVPRHNHGTNMDAALGNLLSVLPGSPTLQIALWHVSSIAIQHHVAMKPMLELWLERNEHVTPTPWDNLCAKILEMEEEVEALRCPICSPNSGKCYHGPADGMEQVTSVSLTAEPTVDELVARGMGIVGKILDKDPRYAEDADCPICGHPENLPAPSAGAGCPDCPGNHKPTEDDEPAEVSYDDQLERSLNQPTSDGNHHGQ